MGNRFAHFGRDRGKRADFLNCRRASATCVPQRRTRHATPSAVFWLTPLQQTPPTPFPPGQHYTLLQKNRMFKPHLLVIPVGGLVDFPNADPFFHNVFSLFDGKRFDLGLYEAGSTKSVTFSREGVSYIFCNIHPEMSAVILTLSTALYAKADAGGAFHLADVPCGRLRDACLDRRRHSTSFKSAVSSRSARVRIGRPGKGRSSRRSSESDIAHQHVWSTLRSPR